jgi:anaerobic dimethyl sulfoxide reductase subunit B (iron-sulfur subunit)
MTTEFIIWFDPEKCTQCYGCEVACRSWRALDRGVRFRKVLNVWRGDFPRVKNHSVAMGCLHCVEPACVAACPEEAIHKRETDGLVRVDEGLCIGCQACWDACLYKIPQFGPKGTMQKCDLCFDQVGREEGPPCVATCPGKALSLIGVSAGEKLEHQKAILALLGERPSRRGSVAQ